MQQAVLDETPIPGVYTGSGRVCRIGLGSWGLGFGLTGRKVYGLLGPCTTIVLLNILIGAVGDCSYKSTLLAAQLLLLPPGPQRVDVQNKQILPYKTTLLVRST